jgi:hypothetical protein
MKKNNFYHHLGIYSLAHRLYPRYSIIQLRTCQSAGLGNHAYRYRPDTLDSTQTVAARFSKILHPHWTTLDRHCRYLRLSITGSDFPSG